MHSTNIHRWQPQVAVKDHLLALFHLEPNLHLLKYNEIGEHLLVREIYLKAHLDEKMCFNNNKWSWKIISEGNDQLFKKLFTFQIKRRNGSVLNRLQSDQKRPHPSKVCSFICIHVTPCTSNICLLYVYMSQKISTNLVITISLSMYFCKLTSNTSQFKQGNNLMYLTALYH